MTISSRTPEGEPAQCPLCNAMICIEPSVLFGDATCPHCGRLLWFLNTPDDTRTFSRDDSEALRDRLLNRLAEQLGAPRDQIVNNRSLFADFGADSLDTVELVMELEEEGKFFDE